ncbi:hypothetical protein QZH41_007412 [Actinostola sp. cb2023]|nr:hypothetical protein QZH41_007412 [Actinostola sp. cb2023]
MATSAANGTNATISRLRAPDKADLVAFATSIAIIGIVTLLGNLACIITFLKTKSLRRKCHYLIMSLCVADFLVGITNLMSVYFFHELPYEDTEFMITIESIDHLAGTTSILTLAAISVERFYAIVFPFRHRRSGSRIYIPLIGIPWVAGVVTGVLTVLSLLKISFPNVCSWINIVLPSVSLLVILISYIGIGIKACKHGSNANKTRSLRDRKLAVTLLIVTVASFATWLPAQIFYAIDFLCKTCARIPYEFFFLIKFLQFLNSGINVFIYFARIPEFRDAFLVTFCFKTPAYKRRSNTARIQRRTKDSPLMAFNPIPARKNCPEKAKIQKQCLAIQT